MEAFEVGKLKDIVAKFEGVSGDLIPVLQEIEERFGYIPEDSVPVIGKALGLPESKIYGVTTFYTQFHLTPRGENIISVCCGTACHVSGADRILDKVKSVLEIDENSDTSEDGKYTVQGVACLGCCGLAPVVTVNEDVYGKISEDSVEEILNND